MSMANMATMQETTTYPTVADAREVGKNHPAAKSKGGFVVARLGPDSDFVPLYTGNVTGELSQILDEGTPIGDNAEILERWTFTNGAWDDLSPPGARGTGGTTGTT